MFRAFVPVFGTDGFSDHASILGDADIQNFLVLALREGSRAALQRVRPRERTEVRTPLGVLVD